MKIDVVHGSRIRSLFGRIFNIRSANGRRIGLNGYSSLRRALICGLWFTALSSLGAVPENLGAAVEAGSSFHAERYLRDGASPNQLVRAEPLLVHAARAGNFEMCRALLRHGADPEVRSQSGQSLVDLPLRTDREALALRFLLRTSLFLKQHIRPPATAPPARPGLVIVFEPTVDYTHPEISPHYFVEAELNGQLNRDDDRDGFIDNIYGWATVSDRPHLVNRAQMDSWSEFRSRIVELADLHNRMQRGELNAQSPPIAKLRTSFRNPIAALFGASGGYSDADFLKAMVAVSHGSHVAGTILESSGRKASIHTLSWDNFGHLAAREFDYPKVTSGNPDVWLAEFRSRSLPEMIARGRRGSDYLRAVQCGVVNGSFGLNLKVFVESAARIVEEMSRLNSKLLTNTVSDIAYEIYAYHTIPFVVAVAENPQIFFVASAGNDDENIDLTLGSPAYLSRYFPNVITVAAANRRGEITGFSNFGRKSVNVGAPGDTIESLGIAGTRLLMSGTSMAAPAVSGFAARLRMENPRLSAVEIRRAIELSALAPSNDWRRWVSSGGVLNPSGATALAARQADAIETLGWRIIDFNPDEQPEAWATALTFTSDAIARAPGNARLWFARAVTLDGAGMHREALDAINRTLTLADTLPSAWRSKCLVLSNLKDHTALLATVHEAERRVESRRLSPDPRERRDLLTIGMEAARTLGANSDLETLTRRYREAFGADDTSRPSAGAGGERRERGRLALGDSTLKNGEFADRYNFSGQAGRRVQIDLFSKEYDPYLLVRSPSGKQWDNDDYNESSNQSRVVIDLPETGIYAVTITSYRAGEVGAYELVISGAEVTPTAQAAPPPLRHIRP